MVRGTGEEKSEKGNRKGEIMEFTSCFTFHPSLFSISQRPLRQAARGALARGHPAAGFGHSRGCVGGFPADDMAA